MAMFVVNILLKISNFIGIDPKIFFYLWKPVTYLLQHTIHLLLVIAITFILFYLRKTKSPKRKIVLNKKP